MYDTTPTDPLPEGTSSRTATGDAATTGRGHLVTGSKYCTVNTQSNKLMIKSNSRRLEPVTQYLQGKITTVQNKLWIQGGDAQ